MIEILINGKVVKTVATLQEACEFRDQYKKTHAGDYQVIGRFSIETDDADYNEYRQAMQDYLYK